MKKTPAMFFFALLTAAMLSACTIVTPVAVSSNPIGPKVGQASSTIILGIISFGDASIQKAAKNAGITKVSTVDMQTSNYLGIVVIYNVIVTGE
jgi:hypothetical protein